MKKYSFLFLILSICELSPAQTTLSLSQAIETALANNFDIRLQKTKYQIAENNNTWGETGIYPTVTLNLTQNQNIRNIDNPTSFVNGRLTSVGTTPYAEMAWTVFDGFKVHINRNKLSLMAEQSSGQTHLIIENTVAAIILNYYKVILEKEKLEVLQHIMSLSKQRYNEGISLNELGLNTSIDVSLNENAYLTDSINVMMQELNYKNNIRNLNLLLNRPLDTEYVFVSPLPEKSDLINKSNILNELKQQNAQLRDRLISHKLTKQDTKLSRSNLYPTVKLNLGMNANRSYFELQDFGSGNGQSAEKYANFTLNFTLFNGGKTMRAIENSKLNEEVALLSVEQLEQELTVEVLQRCDMLDLRQNATTIYEQKNNTTERLYQRAEDQYDLGLINAIELRSIQRDFLQSRLESLENRYALVELETELLKLTGKIVQ